MAIVHLDRAADLQRLVRPKLHVTVEVHDDGVRLAQIRQVALDDLARCSDERSVIQSDENDLLKLAIGKPRAAQALVESHGPFNARYAAHAEQLVLAHGLDVVDKLDVGIHDPDLRSFDVADLTGGQQHQTAKDGALLRDQERGKGHTQDNSQVFAAVTSQHFESDPG